jgi:hypothetical protein
MKSAIALVSVVFVASTVDAQDTLRDAVGVLVTNQSVQTSDFERDRVAAEAARDTIARALLINLTSAPIASSSGGFLYRLNPELGTVQRASQSFGSFFVERALTAGAGRVSFGMTATTASYDRLNGYDLEDGSLVTVANRFRDEAAPFDTEALEMKIRASTMTWFANIGVTDEFDIGVAVPIAQVSLEGTRLNIYRGTPFLQAQVSGNASGLADMAIRAKYAVLTGRLGGLAAAGEVRLPTGDEENLLGAGSMSWRLLGVGTLENGPVGLHANGGIVRGGVSDETILSGALSVAAHPRLTLSSEVLHRHVSELREFMLVAQPNPRIAGVDTFRLLPGPTGTTLVTAVVGAKWNATHTLVLGGHVLWSMRDRGLKAATVTPTVTVEYSLK